MNENINCQNQHEAIAALLLGELEAEAADKIKKHIEGIIDKFNWQDYFSAIAGGDEVARVKPAPDIFHLTLDRMQANPSESIVVGDTINDLLAAKQVPMAIAMIESPYGIIETSEIEIPDFSFNNWTEFINHYFERVKNVG